MTGQTVSHYRILDRLGEGGMGVVYRAEDTRLGRQVAIKFLSERVEADPLARARFVREARAASSLAHPNICALYDVGDHDGRPFFVMELVKGHPLNRQLDAGPLPLDRVLDIGMQVADALDTAHAVGIVHRDIKPANVLLTDRGPVKVLDFGVAKVAMAEGGGGETLTTASITPLAALTGGGSVVGTLGYMSPEQLRGEPVDARTDMFALGALLYEMVTARRAFPGASPALMVQAILQGTPTPLREVRPDLPEALERIVDKALEKDPNLRYQHINELRTDLARLKRDTESRRTHVPAPARNESNRVRSRGMIMLAILGLVFAVLVAVRDRRQVSPAGASQTSIAVLPFVNSTGDTELEYLSDGLTVSLINSLSDLQQLSVKSRSAAFRYKGRTQEPERIGRELNVGRVVSGTVQRRGGLLQVAVELVDVVTGNQIWGAQFDGLSSDLFTLEDDIARSISDQLEVRLASRGARRLSRRYTDNIEAYHLYLRGVFFASSFREEGLRRAIEYYRRALALDEKYALSYTGMAHAYFWLIDWYAPGAEVAPLSLEASRRALAIDDGLAEAHGMLGLVTLVYDWNWEIAERAFRRSLALDPKNAPVRAYYAWLLVAVGRRQEAIAEARRAQELDPLNAEAQTIAALALYLAREHAQSIDASRRALDVDRNFTWAHIVLGRALQATGRMPAAIASLEQARTLEPNLPEALAALGHGYAAAGRTGEARAVLTDLTSLAARRHVSPLDFATLHAGLGETKRAIDLLERSHAERSSYLMPFLACLPFFDTLRSDGRFQRLLTRLNLPSDSR